MPNTNWGNAVVVITGGGSGIGKALSLAIAKRGANIIVADINIENAKKVALDCGGKASSQYLDVRDANAFKALIESTVKNFGKIDYLFNNAGIAIGGESFEITLEAWDRIIDINIRGVVNGICATYPIMVKQKSGHIINTASLAGLGPAPLLTPYGMTKHAVVGLSTSLRLEGKALGVKVSVLCPSAIETPLLDSEHPKDLPENPWRPDFRRYLTKLAGPPYPVEKFAEESISAIEKNTGIIVLPTSARIAWKLGVWLPNLVEKIYNSAIATERKDRK